MPTIGDQSSLFADRTSVSFYGMCNLELNEGMKTTTGQLVGIFNVYEITEHPELGEIWYSIGNDFLAC